MLNCSDSKTILRACVMDKNGYWKHRDIFMVCNSKADIGKNAWFIRKNKVSKNERVYFTFREVLLA